MFIYRYFIYPFFFLSLLVLSFFNQKIRKGISLRIFKSRKSRPNNQKVIWIHCASGEFEYAKPIIKKIKEQNKDVQTLITYFSPSFLNAIQESPYVDHHEALPFDFKGPILDFINYYKPSHLLIARTDMWPELLTQSRLKNISTAIFSYTASDKKTEKSYQKKVLKWLFNKIDHIFCVTQDDFKNLLAIDSTIKSKVTVAGDSRYEQVIERLANPKNYKKELFTRNHKKESTITIGSSWTEDEDICLPAFKIAKQQNADLKLIIAPHEPTAIHISTICKKLDKLDLTYQNYTSAKEFSSDVLIIDTIGVLAELYQNSKLAIVGGSFKKTVHSVMEPLAAGNAIILGPYHKNNREALDFQHMPLNNQLKAISIANTAEEVAKIINQYLTDTTNKCYPEIIDSIKKKNGASQLIIEWLNNQITAP